MHDFLANHRNELIARCRVKVALRPQRFATKEQLANGIPLFLDQLIRTFKAERADSAGESFRISGASGGDAAALSEMGVSASAQGKMMLKLGFTIDQVVHNYGDVCQAITDLAFDLNAPFTVDEFRTLNRCLDNAIADAVSEFSFQRDFEITDRHAAYLNQQLGFMAHELRNALMTAMYAVKALETGNMTITGATGAVLNRSLGSLGKLIDRSLDEVRIKGVAPAPEQIFSFAAFITDAYHAADLDARARGCVLTVSAVDPLLGMRGNHDLLLAALGNLLQNAFKFTHRHTEVTLNAYAQGDRLLMEVKDHCGGLPPGDTEKMFSAFSQRSDDRTGLGLGLSIARQNVEADGGVLSVRNAPGVGCIFTISLPRYALPC